MEVIDLPSKPTEFVGPHCTLRSPVKEPWLTQPTIEAKIEHLAHEAIASLYRLHWTNVQHLYGIAGLRPGAWGPMATEERNFLDTVKRDKRADRYALTFDHVRGSWEHREMFPACLTDLGADELNREYPNPCPKCVQEGNEATCKSHVYKRGDIELCGYTVRGTLPELQRQWINLFSAKVQSVLSAVPSEEARTHVANLSHRLTTVEIGTAEGAKVTDQMSREVKGREALRILQEVRAGLVERLVAMVQTTPNGSTSTSENSAQSEQPPPTFLALLGERNLATTLAIINDLGYRITAAKGKGLLIASMEAALEHFGVPIPMAKHWPYMLNVQFDGIKAGTKATPPMRPTQRTKAYKDARDAMFDRLRG